MGYRNYIGVIPKKEYNKIKSLTKEDFFKLNKITVDDDGDMSDWVSPYEICKELYEFGKYCDFKTKGLTLQFFKKKDLHELYNIDGELLVVKKEFLEHVIENYHEKIKSYYLKLLDGVDAKDEATFTNQKFYELYEHIKTMSIDWIQLKNFDLHDGKESITRSWKYEYGLFELIRIYKSFDWKKNVMAYYGY